MAMMGKDYWGLPICTQWEIHLAIWVGITSIGIVAQGWFILAHSGIFWPWAIVSPMGLITLSSHWRPDWSNQLQRKSLYLMNKVGIQIWFSFCGEGASFNLPSLYGDAEGYAHASFHPPGGIPVQGLFGFCGWMAKERMVSIVCSFCQVHHECYEFVLLLGFAQMIYEKFKK